jgi:hypothetical protein
MGNEECRMLKSKIGTEQVNYEGKEGSKKGGKEKGGNAEMRKGGKEARRKGWKEK